MILLYAIVGCSVLLFAISLANVITYPVFEKLTPARKSKKKVSILIPARNEEKNIAACLQGVFSQTYQHIEVLVYEDSSTDTTLDVLKQLQQQYDFKIVRGKKLPKGWKGKSHACHHLATQATGEYLCFIDADVQLKPTAIARVMQSHKGGLFSVFAYQIQASLGERATVPVLNWFLLSALPFALIEGVPQKQAAAAMGAFMCFTRECYDHVGGHAAVKDALVEDMALAHLTKERGRVLQTYISQGDIRVHMYSNFLQGVQGLSRSLQDSWQTNPVAYLFTTLLTAVFLLGVYLSLPHPLAIVALSFLIINKVFIGVLTKDLWSIVLTPVHHLMIIVMALHTMFQRNTTWKGRTY